jgi:hypothetical protein
MLYKNQQSVRIRTFLERLYNLPLNTELNAESASGELSECIRNDPERNEHSSEENGNTRREQIIISGVVWNMFTCVDTHMIARRRPMY